MLDFLRTVFGSNINIEEYDYPAHAPMYIRDNYKIYKLSWNSNNCVLLSPHDPSLRLPTLKKQLRNFQMICDYPCALWLDGITALQRRNLLEDNIPFIAASQQVYLPFWGVAFTEKFKTTTPTPEKMAPGTQLVFLYLYYLQNTDSVNLTMIAKDLHISKATCTRAVNDLAATNLITSRLDGKTKWIAPAYEKDEFLKNGYVRLNSPVEKQIYAQSKEKTSNYLKSGILALSEISLVGANKHDGAAAVYRKNTASISPNNIISKEEFEDFGGYIIEVWSYDPALFAHDGRVDEISLLLSLDHDKNERIQSGLDTIRKKYGLPIEEDLW